MIPTGAARFLSVYSSASGIDQAFYEDEHGKERPNGELIHTKPVTVKHSRAEGSGGGKQDVHNIQYHKRRTQFRAVKAFLLGALCSVCARRCRIRV